MTTCVEENELRHDWNARDIGLSMRLLHFHKHDCIIKSEVTMPYKRIGRKVYHKKNGRWSLKQTARTIKNAQATIRLLRGIEHGMKPRRRR